MTPAELNQLRDLIRTIRASAQGTGILGPAALVRANFSHERAWMREEVAA
jgi:hypothetical protein